MVFTSVDGYLKVYAWNNADIKFKQAINITGLSTNTPINNYLLLGSATSLVLYKYNPTTIQYDLIISINSQTGIQKYSISQDSILMAVAKTGFILDIYTITGSSYTVTTLPIPSVPAGSTSVWNLKLRNRSGTYVLIIVFTTGSDHFFSYYVITSTTINLMQVVDQTIYSSSLVNSYNIYDIWLTTNTQYIVAVTSSQTNWILVY